MALAPESFADGDTTTGAYALLIYMDFNKTNDYEELCALEFSENSGINVETFVELCKGGVSSTEITHNDPEFSFEALLRKNQNTQMFWNNRYNRQAISGIPTVIYDTHANEKIVTKLTFSGLERTSTGEELSKISGTLKPSDGRPCISEIPAGEIDDKVQQTICDGNIVPVITIASDEISVSVGEVVNETFLIDNYELKALDFEDGDITQDITLSTVDTSVAGTVSAIATVADSGGAIATKTISIIVS